MKVIVYISLKSVVVRKKKKKIVIEYCNKIRELKFNKEKIYIKTGSDIKIKRLKLGSKVGARHSDFLIHSFPQYFPIS